MKNMSTFNSADIAAFTGGVWVFCEQRQGKMMSTSYELISEGRKLADERGTKLYGLLLGDGIEGIAKDIEVGDVYLGKVVRIMNFGAFIELTPGKDGMLHISKMADHRVEKVEDVMNIGDKVEVKVNEIDSQGRINLIRNDITYPSHEGGQRPFSGERRRPPRRDGRPSGGSDRT